MVKERTERSRNNARGVTQLLVAVPDARGLSTCDHVVLAEKLRDAADRIERGQ
jgi:hypothetical protein